MNTKTKQPFPALRVAMQAARDTPEDVHEIDYLCSFIARGVAEVPQLSESLVLKGANALRKCYFSDSRRSKDLDYSALPGISPNLLSESIQEACGRINRALKQRGAVSLTCSAHSFAIPPPVPLSAFDFSCVFPWRKEPTTVSVEVSLDEKLVTVPKRRRLIHAFGEPLAGTITVYSIEEMVAEKLRSILQWTRQNIEKGRTSMPAARTYYDLWWLLTRRKPRLNLKGFDRLLEKKCSVRAVTYQNAGSFFNPALTQLTRANWSSQLAGLVTHLPEVDRALADAQRTIALLIAKSSDKT